MSFYKRLNSSFLEKKSFLCIGLDPQKDKIPSHYFKKSEPYFEWAKDIIDQTYDLTCAYKPQIAYFSSVGAEEELVKIIRYIKEKDSSLLVILDSKRGDIGNTAKEYAKEAFERYGADAVTVNPYLGLDSVEPFLSYSDKGIIVLCRTSNPGARDFQDLKVEGESLYLKLAREISQKWNKNQNISLVVGATYPKEMQEIRSRVGDIPFLVPGIGAQGGDLGECLRHGGDSQGMGLLFSSSRAIIYAENPRKAALETVDLMRKEFQFN